VGGVSLKKIARLHREVAPSRFLGVNSVILYCSFPGRFANDLFGKAIFLEQGHWLGKDKDIAGRIELESSRQYAVKS